MSLSNFTTNTYGKYAVLDSSFDRKRGIKYNFTSGTTAGGVSYSTATFERRYLEVDFLNGTINFYDAEDLHYKWH
jgi:hypothetical protein